MKQAIKIGIGSIYSPWTGKAIKVNSQIFTLQTPNQDYLTLHELMNPSVHTYREKSWVLFQYADAKQLKMYEFYVALQIYM